MDEINVIQVLVTALLSSGFIGGFLALIQKKIWSPESENDLVRIGNEFANQLLLEARVERKELRLTITELESVNASKEDSIARLLKIVENKDAMIRQLESRQYALAEKIREGEVITFRDLFGSDAPDPL